MAFENNPFLNDVAAANQSLLQFTQLQDQLKKKAAVEEFQKQAPQLLAANGVNENMSQLAGLGLQAGDNTAYESLLKNALAPKSTTGSPIGMEQATLLGKALGITNPDMLTAASQLPLSNAQTLFNQQRVAEDANVSQSLKREGLELNKRSQGRLEREELQKQRNTVVGGLKALEKDFADQAAALGAVKAALANGTKPAQSIVENFLLRSVAGEKGPLSDSDRASFAAKSGFNSFQNAQNYFTGVPSSNWTDAQREAFKELVGIAEAKDAANRATKIADWYGQSAYQAGLTNDAETQKVLGKTLDKYGFQKSPEGQLTKKISEKKVALGAETPVTEMISVIKDPVKKKQAEDAVARYAGKAVPQVLLDRIKAAAQE